MGNDARPDAARQVTTVLGAVLQAAAGGFFVANLAAEPVADAAGSTPIDPAGYAFFVWAPILLLSLAYAVYQALPSRRGDRLLRRVGWPLAAAFVCNGLWEVVSVVGRPGVAQVLIAALLGFLAVAYLRLTRAAPGTMGRLDRWLVALPVGIYFGWITAANAVSLASLLVRSGAVDGAGPGGATVGAVLLVLGSAAATVVVRVGRGSGPPQAWVGYGATVLWALFGVAANQYRASPPAAAVALGCAVLVASAFTGGRRGGPSPHPGRTAVQS